MAKTVTIELTGLMRDQFAVESTDPCVLVSTGVLGAMVDPVEFASLIVAAMSAAEDTGDADLVEALDAALGFAHPAEAEAVG